MMLLRTVITLFFSFFLAKSSFCVPMPEIGTALGVVHYCWNRIQNSSLSIQERQDFAAIGFTTIVTGIAPLYQREGKERLLSNKLAGETLNVMTTDPALSKVQIMGLSRTQVATNEQALLYMSITAAAAGLGIDIVGIVEKAQSLNALRPWRRHLALLYNLSTVIKSNRDSTAPSPLDKYFSNLNYGTEGNNARAFLAKVAVTLEKTVAPPGGSCPAPLRPSDNEQRIPGIQEVLTQVDTYLGDNSWAVPPPLEAAATETFTLFFERLTLNEDKAAFEQQKLNFEQEKLAFEQQRRDEALERSLVAGAVVAAQQQQHGPPSPGTHISRVPGFGNIVSTSSGGVSFKPTGVLRKLFK